MKEERRVPSLGASVAEERGRRQEPTFLWPLLTAVATIVAALIPLLFNRRFYFFDDTQAGAYGIWVEIGEKLRAGDWPLFSIEGWAAGNYAAEGQWGIWNPMIMAIGLGASTGMSAVLFSSIVKIVFLVILALGVFNVCRTYRATPEWSAVAGVATTLTGFTTYMDGPSWVTGLMVFALLPWCWWGLKRLADGGNPLSALIPAYLLITIGYVHGTIMLVILFIALLAEALLLRTGKGALRLIVAGALCGAFALTVYFPGVATAPVTARGTVIGNSGFLGIDITGLASSPIPSSLPQITGWWGAFAPVPVLYIAWFLPLLLLTRPTVAQLRPAAALLVFGAASLLLTLAPSDLGPLRFPVRLMPYFAMSVLIVFAVLMSTVLVSRLTRLRVGAVILALGFSAYLAWSQNPDFVRLHVLFTGLAGLAILLVLLALFVDRPVLRRHGLRIAALIAVVFCLATAVAQKKYFPAAPLPDFQLPAEPGAYDDVLPDSKGSIFVVGEPAQLGEQVWDETLVSNSWYLADKPVHNLYSPIMYTAYSEDLCMTSHGWTCAGAIFKLLSVDEATGKTVAELLDVDTIQILREPQDSDGAILRSRVAPAGWTEVERTENSATWVRDDVEGAVGEPVATSAGTEVEVISNGEEKVSFEVTRTGADGGSVVLSRLDWPGYSVSNGSIGDSTRGYLLTVDVGPESEGQVVTVSFEPPAWNVLVPLMWVAICASVLWGVLGGLLARVLAGRRRSASRREPAAERESR
ncbi:hypothetical protein D6T63_12075 [Arthrobacter cheniae]|uniref:Integral membrane protein n=1 Tax=Arthrobacter cheniae TaxID=1258888 RepID=A0A3A5M0R6_9MICC|nr:hypothetical protein [Arthrobacter cheniae]RJT78265.1 hypothetical protein D6T63_12075 [Arthrobacter cheniae]